MATFSYRAMNQQGRVVNGQMDAINLIDLEMRLKRIELDFIAGRTVEASGWMLGAGVPRRELINFCFHLEQLTRAGVPILEGLTDLRDSLTHPRFREVVAGMIESIEGGLTLSQAMSAHGKVFTPVVCSLVRAGEETGNLPEVLRNLFESLKWEDELASHTKKLVIYPAIVSTFVLVSTVVVMIYLVPQLANFFKLSGQSLPLQTVALMAVSSLFVHFWYLIFGLPIVGLVTIKVLAEVNPLVRFRLDAMKLAIPVVGPILRKIMMSRFAGVLAMMYTSGIPLIDAVRTTEGVVGNVVLRGAIERAGALISEGQNVVAAFESTGLFPALVLRMLRIGQSTGALDTSLANVSYFYNRDVREDIEKLQKVLEPALTLVLGMLLLWVMLSVLGPVYDIIAKLRF